MICGNERTDRILARAFAAYARTRKAIDILEKAGLSIEGGSMADKPGHEDMSVLYGAMTDMSDIVQEIFGIKGRPPYSEQADMVLSEAAIGDDYKMPDRTMSALASIADTARKAAMLPKPDGAKLYEVTVAMSGGIQVLAENRDKAMETADRMDSSEILESAAWDGPSATDAYDAL